MRPFTSVVISNVAGFGEPKPCISWLSVCLLLNHCRDFRSFGSEGVIGALLETHKTVFRAQIRARSTSFGQNTVPRGRTSRGCRVNQSPSTLTCFGSTLYQDNKAMDLCRSNFMDRVSWFKRASEDAPQFSPPFLNEVLQRTMRL